MIEKESIGSPDGSTKNPFLLAGSDKGNAVVANVKEIARTRVPHGAFTSVFDAGDLPRFFSRGNGRKTRTSATGCGQTQRQENQDARKSEFHKTMGGDGDLGMCRDGRKLHTRKGLIDQKKSSPSCDINAHLPNLTDKRPVHNALRRWKAAL
jgi:hypothetical protein